VPAQLLGFKKGALSLGADADVTIFSPDEEWTFDRNSSLSKSQNSPFYGWRLKGKVTATIVSGKRIASEQNALAGV